MLKAIMLFIAVTVGAFASGTSFAADLSVGVVDVKLVLQKSKKVANIMENLKSKFVPREEALNKKRDSFKGEVEKFNRDKDVINKDTRIAHQKDIMKKDQDIRRETMAFRRDLVEAQKTAMQTVIDKMRIIVGDIAKRERLNIVLQKEFVPYLDKNLDISEKVLRDLDRS